MEEQSTKDNNKMGTMPVNKLLLNMAWPMMVSMLVQAMYNIVDSMFVARVEYGKEALTAVSLVFPVQTLMIAFGAGTGVGINALLSRSLGEKRYEEANKTAVNGIFLMLLTYIGFLIFGLTGAKAFVLGQTADENVAGYGVQYLQIVSIFSLGLFMQMVFERLQQATGNTFNTMISQGIGAIANIILDPIFIFGWFGVPKMEVAGAAIATVSGQFLAMFVAIYLNAKKNKEITVSFKGFRPQAKTIKAIYAVGIPSIIMQAVMSVTTYCMNRILGSFDSAVAAYGVYFKLNSFIFMPVFGMNNGMVPIIAFNYGARHKDRIRDTIKLAMTISISIMCVGLLIFQIFPRQLLVAFFNADEQLLAVGVPALRIISASFVVAGACIILISTLQALGEGVKSMIISLARQVGVLIPASYILCRLFGLPAGWAAFPLAECTSLIVSIIFFRYVWKTKIKGLEA